jgi:hypothetical protein
MRRDLILGMLCSTLIGCYARDNPFDPGRCNGCPAGQTCYNGECVRLDARPGGSDGARDAGAGDLSADGAAAKGPAILFSVRQGSPVSTTYTSWTDIPGLAPQTVTADGKDRHLILLSVPDTWVTSSVHQGGKFQLLDGTTRLAYGMYTAGKDNRLPFTLIAARQLSAGTHTISAQWQTSSTDYSLNIGSCEAWLVVVRAGENDLVAATGSSSSDLQASKNAWTDLPGLSVTAKVTGDQLLVLNIPATSLHATTWFRIILDDGTSTMLAYGTAQPDTPNFASQGMPVTLVAVTNLAAGQRVKAQWNGTSSAQSIIYSGPAEERPTLVALRPPSGISHGSGLPSANILLSSTSYKEIGSLSPNPVPITSAGGRHLFLFSAPYSVVDTAGGSVSYNLVVDKTPLAESVARAGIDWQDIPHTVIGVKDLTSGAHALTAQWKYTGPAGGNAVLGQGAPHWLIGFAP